MGLEGKTSAPKNESVEGPKVHTITEFKNAIRHANREILTNTRPEFVAALTVATLADYVRRGDHVHLVDESPQDADENTLLDTWNGILNFVDEHQKSDTNQFSVRDTRDTERQRMPQFENEDPHIADYQLLIPDSADSEKMSVTIIDFLYEIYRNKKSFVEFLAFDLDSLKIQKDSRMYDLCKDKPWWSDTYLAPDASVTERRAENTE